MRVRWFGIGLLWLMPLPATALDAIDPTILGTCPPAVHDRYVVTAPDGLPYRTWHPQVAPIDAKQRGGPTCTFAHEHGDDPRRSRANKKPPAFGYVNHVAGHDHEEPHEGFKVFVANRGTLNDEGRKAKTSTRIVAHMGTGGVGRYTRRLHSFEFDLKGGAHQVHVRGMADTFAAGSICERDAGAGIGRVVVTVPGTGCDLGSLYEIWQFVFSVRRADGGEVARIHASTAAFDPITVMNPADRTQLVFTRDAFPQYGDRFGCDREAYHGPVYWYNRFGVKRLRTDAFGAAQADGPLEQEISLHDAIGIPMSPDQSQFKLHRPTCGPGLGVKN